MENHAFSAIDGSASAPYMNSLASQCGLATNYFAIIHPSLPNYIAATSGSPQGITDDDPPSAHPLSVASIYSQVKAAGLTWRDYEESAPGNCPLSSCDLYAVRHDPAPYYTGIRSDCANWDVPLGTIFSGNFVTDINAGRLPAFAFVTPNLCNDMHDCPVRTGDAWLAQWVPKIVAGANYQAGDTLVVVTFDEDDGSDNNRVWTAVVAPSVIRGTRSGARFDHYSLLRTTEELLGLPTLGGAAGAASIAPAFHLR
jgi:phospholipase C